MKIDRPNTFPDAAYALSRIAGIFHPDVEVYEAPSDIRIVRDAEVRVRDGTILRANVYLPAAEGKYPVVMCAHPYGKDALPVRTPFGYVPSPQFRLLRQAGHVRFSSLATWESPDPAFWTAAGYAVVNCDLRGFGRSEGTGTLVSEQEAHDYYDLIEWAAAQPWSTGRIGLNGVSYLALSQWMVAALRPPHLAAICPWEGFSDLYRDFARPGGIREDGFLPLWATIVSRRGRVTENLLAEQRSRPLYDAWWASKCAQLERIEVPALICGSFSDQFLHSRGSIEGFWRIGSRDRWLYTHRGGKWAVYYSPEALGFQRQFFDCFLKGEQNGMREVPPVRLEVRSDRTTVSSVRFESQWPPENARWTRLFLSEEGTLVDGRAAEGKVSFNAANGTASFVWRVPRALEVAGPMALSLDVSLEGCTDATLFAFVRKVSNGANVPFEGSYGYAYDAVANGWQRVSLRKLDAEKSLPWRPFHPYDESQPLAPGEQAEVAIELLSSATSFAEGDELQLDVRAHWLFAHKNIPVRGPQAYESGPSGTITLAFGGAGGAHLIVPIVPIAPTTPAAPSEEQAAEPPTA